MTVTGALRVRSKPRVSADSLKYEPLLEAGTDLRVLAGPVAASGFWWYRVRLPDGMTLSGGIASGWVAAADHGGTVWIAQETGGTDPVPDPVYPAMPTPVLFMGGAEAYVDASGAPYVRHDMSISNWADFPRELLASMPGQDSCGSRTLVEIVDADTDNRIYGFCGFSEPRDLAAIWFGTPAGDAPPPSVYVQLLDQEALVSVWSDPVKVCPLAYGPGCKG